MGKGNRVGSETRLPLHRLQEQLDDGSTPFTLLMMLLLLPSFKPQQQVHESHLVIGVVPLAG